MFCPLGRGIFLQQNTQKRPSGVTDGGREKNVLRMSRPRFRTIIPRHSELRVGAFRSEIPHWISRVLSKEWMSYCLEYALVCVVFVDYTIRDTEQSFLRIEISSVYSMPKLKVRKIVGFHFGTMPFESQNGVGGMAREVPAPPSARGVVRQTSGRLTRSTQRHEVTEMVLRLAYARFHPHFVHLGCFLPQNTQKRPSGCTEEDCGRTYFEQTGLFSPYRSDVK